MSLQEDWRWCNRCQGLAFKGFGDGICFDEGPHYLAGSATYAVGFDEAPNDAQEGWIWCSRCQGLVFGENGGTCFNGEPHVLSDSRPYWVNVDVPPPGAQDGWRWCNRCGRLIYSGFGSGICWDGAAHDFAGSGNYSVQIIADPPPRPDPPANPVIEVVERQSHIEVSGSLFTPDGRVALAFVHGPDVKQVPLTADGDGRFEYVERDVRPIASIATVIARDQSTPLFALARLEQRFPRQTGGAVPIDAGTEPG